MQTHLSGPCFLRQTGPDKGPDIIDVGQELDVKKDYGQDQVDDAKQKAKDTPPYKPHSTPRKSLPLKY